MVSTFCLGRRQHNKRNALFVPGAESTINVMLFVPGAENTENIILLCPGSENIENVMLLFASEQETYKTCLRINYQDKPIASKFKRHVHIDVKD